VYGLWGADMDFVEVLDARFDDIQARLDSTTIELNERDILFAVALEIQEVKAEYLKYSEKKQKKIHVYDVGKDF